MAPSPSDSDVEFPSPFSCDRDWEDGETPRTVIEYRMCALSATLREKPLWWEKRKDTSITDKWQKEALEQDITEDQWNYVLAELEGHALLRDEKSGAQVSCYDKIWQSDTLISAEDRAALQAAVKKLEDVPDEDKDWHPGSNGQVLDLVHPSLYPLVYGRTLVKPDNKPADASGLFKKLSSDAAPTLSKQFQWLPTDFEISETGDSAKALAYINNIHPSNVELTGVVEHIVASFVSLWDRVLTDQLPENQSSFPVRHRSSFERDETLPGEPKDEEADNHWERHQEWYETLPIVPTLVDPYEAAIHERSRMYSLNGRKIQVIVKLANIVLTPEKPSYPGGSWHVEGMRNESIVASGIYYYDEDNISESRLAFRVAVATPDDYPQDDNVGTRFNYNLERDDELVQEVGSVITKQGRCIAFPNYYQHQVQPFRLVDSTKPGHRKIVALFLVDPTKAIPSTSDVAPQQREWLNAELSKVGPTSRLYKLPPELVGLTLENVDSTMTKAEAFKYREQLMEERTQFIVASNGSSGYFGATFNMCEH